MTLNIPREVWLKMLCYAKLALPNEVTGIGVIEYAPDDDGYVRSFTVTEVQIAPQFTSGGYCEFKDEALHGIYSDFIEAGRIEDVQKLRFRWHSHANGQVFFSTTDVKDINRNNLNIDWMVSLVLNVNEDFIARLDSYQPFRNSVPLDVKIHDDVSPELIEQCRLDIVKMVDLLSEHDQCDFASKIDSGWNGAKNILRGGEEDEDLFRPGEVI